MAAPKDSKAKRLSSLFSLGSQEPKVPVPPSPSSSRLLYSSRNQSPSGQRLPSSQIRLSSSAQHLPLSIPSNQSPSLTPSSAPGFDDFTNNSLLLPPPIADLTPLRTSSPPGSRSGSKHGSRPGSRPVSPIRSFASPDSPLWPLTPTTEARLSKRRSWFPGSSLSESQGASEETSSSRAWISGAQGKIPYDISHLRNAQTISELWDEDGDTFVYLYPKDTGKGPSFKVDSAIYSSSTFLTILAHGEVSNDQSRTVVDNRGRSLESHTQQLSLNVPISPPSSPKTDNGSSQGSRTLSDSMDEPPNETHLYVPIGLKNDPTHPQPRLSAEDTEALVAVRNLFAFLVGQSLVATSRHPSIFSIFLQVSDLLIRFGFTNLDSSTYGEVADLSFSRYIEELGLADIRSGREKTIEGIVLGERMRSWELYEEAFVHGVGKYDDIVKLGSRKFNLISSKTRKRMERASMDLFIRLKSVRTRLEDFDFPSLFAGIANSTTNTEAKTINFKAWKSAFISMRKHTMALYKQRYGSWPPKARSKKNAFEESGLNRILLKELYQDFSDLYDMLVDRTALTPRGVDMPSQGMTGGSSDPQEATALALRHLMSEYDRSSPPVQPPIPFDTPLLPSLASVRSGFDASDRRKQAKERAKKLKDDEINLALRHSYNNDSVETTPFLEAFMLFERRSAHGKSVDDICDLRNGQWIFLYAVLQALPMVVIDAPGVRWTKGVEYFLCEVPKGSAPWSKEDNTNKKSWYGIAGGSGVVSLPADVVDHGVEGIYRRSHCWEAAERWTGYSMDMVPTEAEELETPLPSPPILMTGAVEPRTPSLDRHSQRKSVHLGLEALPFPRGVAPSLQPGSRPVSSYDPNKSFEAILGNSGVQTGKKKK
ncbi:MAG: hypothetical protein M1830_003640 [Pleopsidium flavum]|nr:MAG: hypothetical protein M1830_003640 [Pleopsidium flavum]